MLLKKREVYVMVKILHHGAVEGVTGSCHEIVFDDKTSLLIDCGIFQGGDSSPYGVFADNQLIDFDITRLRGLLCTHVHNDHIAQLPYLIAAGFDQPIYCSFPSSILLPEVLRESIKMSGIVPRNKIEALVERIKKLLKPLSYDQWYSVLPGVEIRLMPTGHILGACYIECDNRGERFVFSGDLGCSDNKLLNPPVSPEKATTLVLEATYGNRLHGDRSQRGIYLEHSIEKAVQDRGAVLIPAFSLGRTQEILFELERIISRRLEQHADDSWADIAVVVDSPLASRFNKLYRKLKPYWHHEALERYKQGDRPFSFKNLITVKDHETHLKVVQFLKKTAQPTIVVSASGMLSGGRIMNYLQALLPDERTDLLFVGYQANGTLGRRLIEGERHVVIDGEKIDVNAKIHVLKGFSAHADKNDLLAFVNGIKNAPQEIRIVHGDDRAKSALCSVLKAQYPQSHVWIP